MSTNWIDALNENKNIYNSEYEFNNLILDENCFKFLVNDKYINKQCAKYIENFKNDLSRNKYDKIYILLQWTTKSKFLISSLIDYLNNFDSKIYLVGNAKFQNISKVSYDIAVKTNISEENLAEEFFRNIDKKNVHFNSEIKKFSLDKKLNFINEYEFYCKANLCELFDDDFNLFMWDQDHLTEYGSKFLGKRLLKLFQD